jgi:filamentous hemagglutinin
MVTAAFVATAGGGWPGLARDRADTAHLRFHDDDTMSESMELSHEPIPAREGGRDFVPLCPQDHAAHDPYRRPGY